MTHFSIIGAAIGSSAGIPGCELAPDLIRSKLPYLSHLWEQTISCGEVTSKDRFHELAIFSWRLAALTKKVLLEGKKFITFGGDHSCAIGTWSGVAQVVDPFGLIWIDAHMDAHTPATSPSGNPHGMPVACLLGSGDPRLTNVGSAKPKVAPSNLVLMGIRSFEEGEAALLNHLGVRVYMMDEVQARGFETCLREAFASLRKRGLGVGLSIDMDSLDPRDFSALGTPEKQGIRLQELLRGLGSLDFTGVLGVEFTEYNPTLEDSSHPGVEAFDKILHHLPGLLGNRIAAAR